MQETTTLSALKAGDISSPANDVGVGLMSAAAFALTQRAARMMAQSNLLPVNFQEKITKYDRYGHITEERENPKALSNCAMVLTMSARMNADPIMIAQNLYIIEGKPSWSSQWIIAAINNCGRFSPLRYDIKHLGPKKMQYTTFYWENKQKLSKTETVEVDDITCTAWVIEKETGERLEAPPVSIEMAVKEGWYTKSGSKWQTMPELMLRYRAAAFFGRLYAPELLMGLQSSEEIHDVIDVTADEKGVYKANIEELKPAPKKSKEPKPQPAPVQQEHIDTETGEILIVEHDQQPGDDLSQDMASPPLPESNEAPAPTRKTKQLDLG